MKNIKAIKYMAIVALCSALDISLHIILIIIFHLTETGNFGDLSLIAKSIGASGAGLLWAVTAYSTVAFVFYRYEDKLSGIKSVKGLRYGSSIGILWLWGVVESACSGITLIKEFVLGLCDAVPVMLLGLLLGIFTIKNNSSDEMKKTHNRTNIFPSILIFAIVYLVGRYILYYTKIIKSSYEISPLVTIIWTIVMGAFIGISYILLGQTTKSSSTLLAAIKFGLVVFGVNWIVFQLFIPLTYEGYLVDIIIRSTTDIVCVILSYYLSETFEKTIYHKRK